MRKEIKQEARERHNILMRPDIYVLKRTRAKKQILQFLDNFLPKRQFSGFTYDMSTQQAVVFQAAGVDGILRLFAENTSLEENLYWKNQNHESSIRHGMIFFIPEGYTIFGLSLTFQTEYGNQTEAQACLEQMKTQLNSQVGYITFECLPELDPQKFLAIVHSFNQTMEEE